MKALNWIAWISTGIGVLFLVATAISAIIGCPLFNLVESATNFFHGANSFFLLAIVLFINKYIYMFEHKKE